MVDWLQFETEAPDLAGEVRRRFEAHSTHVLATIRRDGSPRVSGSEVQFDGTDLTFGSMPNARKARDLQRDGRCAIHAHPSDGDAKVAGVAIEVAHADSPAVTEPSTEPHLFRLDLTEAVLTTVDQEAQQLVVQSWRPGRGITVTRRQ
ncbi:pyridoxamine 5'-phosphate oxidase family protein [Nocardia sp. CDC160]|uniref:pyridoxamine 5'-phosphate oxidase family protein n=1 Tax=Nocardia sp. CDC160 TaxID=3112166 RepID=UPI002DB67D43|nr:pyridoxamine 5'-phosphate oxidase family protein [Nocardia sp. CDC160]MEC3918721.1 pyridoxamine 5'-phosphate oxidase family protein [Nocardia sp. CDC160]